MNKIIINADDYGLSVSSTEAILSAFRENLITDTTVLANGEDFDNAIQKAKDVGITDKLGIHFNLTEGKPLTKDICRFPEFVSNGEFHGKINRTKRLTKAQRRAIYTELTAQINKLLTVGIMPNHADSHHHIHTAIFIAPIVARVCKENGIKKIRLHRNIGCISKLKQIVKKAYNKWLSNKGFITTEYFGSLEDAKITEITGATEIMVHPDIDKNGELIDRADFIDGYPAGKKLVLPKGVKQEELMGYNTLI